MRAIICGKGGQGVITLNYTLGALATELGYNAISNENHGLAVRGGSVSSSLIIGNSHTASIKEKSANLILSTSTQEIDNNIKYLSDTGIIITEKEYITEKNIKVFNINAKSIAYEKFNNQAFASSILLGKTISIFNEIFNIDKSIEILKNYKKINIDALLYGINL